MSFLVLTTTLFFVSRIPQVQGLKLRQSVSNSSALTAAGLNYSCAAKSTIRNDTTVEFFTLSRQPDDPTWPVLKVEIPKNHTEFMCGMANRMFPVNCTSCAYLYQWSAPSVRSFFLRSVNNDTDVYFLDPTSTVISTDYRLALARAYVTSPPNMAYALFTPRGALQSLGINITDPVKIGSLSAITYQMHMSKYIYDAVIVLSGGLTDMGTPNACVTARLDAAAPFIAEAQFVILNSRGTPHKPPPLSSAGFPIDESVASAEYLVSVHNIEAEKILLDSWSMDTIGNAYFALHNHVIPRGLSNIVVVTSEFHMTRSRLIFDHIFSLNPASSASITYVSSPDCGIDADALQARREKEQDSAHHYIEQNMKIITDLRSLNNFIFSIHGAYSFSGIKAPRIPLTAHASLLGSY